MLSRVFLLALGFASIVQSAPLPLNELEVAAVQLLKRAVTSHPVLSRRDSSYTVVNGDTGDSIAQEEGCTFDQLSAANPGVSWTDLQIGQVLNLPTGSYTVVNGDTGDAIASAHGITFDQLSAANPGVNWTDLQIGQVLNLPPGTGSSTSTTTASSTTFTTAAVTTTAVDSSAPATTEAATTEATTTAAATTEAATTAATTTAVPQKAPTTAPAASVVASSIAASSSSSSSGSITVNSIAKLTGSLAVATVNDGDSSAAGTDSYTFYSGDGSTSAGWPSISDWASFDDMWNNNADVIGKCDSAWGVADNTADETEAVKLAIDAVAAASAVDHRFILATIMQESQGCVRVITTTGSVSNPGLMQDHDGTGTCNTGGAGTVPCPQSEITQMIVDGVMGTLASSGGGDGSVQVLEQAQTKGGSAAQAFYMAARIYNSGSLDPSGDLGKGDATHCYASDIANRLTGWATATRDCTLD